MGGLLGIGLFFLFQSSYTYWLSVVSGIVLWVTIGIIIARVSGVLVEDLKNKRQWLWVVAELIVATIALYFWSE